MRLLALVLLAALAASAQHNDANYDEAKVPKYTLPDPLVLQNGQRVKNAQEWNEKRRPELLNLFRTEMYGRRPGKPEHMTFELAAIDKQALGGKAVRKEATVYFAGKKMGRKMDILIYLPAGATKPVPVFLGLNFGPNQTVSADPGIRLRDAWVRDGIVEAAGEEAVDGGVARIGRQPLAGGEDPGPRLRAGDGVLWRHRAGFRWRHAVRRASAVLRAKARTRARRSRPGVGG